MEEVWRGRIGKCVPNSEKLGVQYGPTAAGRRSVLITPPILKNEVRIYRCARARLTAYTLLYNLIRALAILKEHIFVKHNRTQNFYASVHIFDILTSYGNF